ILSDAEALCDRVGVVHQGELRGVGVVSELRMQKSGQIEVTWEGPELGAQDMSLCYSHTQTGSMIRAVVLESNLDTLLDALRRTKAKLISVNPQYGALEEYFF